MSTKDGGPAFPAPDLGEQDFGQRGAYFGMTLRDYFAAKAMDSLLAGKMITKSGVIGCNRMEHMLAEESYKVADAMLAAREAK